METIPPEKKEKLSKRFKNFLKSTVSKPKIPVKMENITDSDDDSYVGEQSSVRGEGARLGNRHRERNRNLTDNEAYLEDVRRIIQDSEATTLNWGTAFDRFFKRMFKDHLVTENRKKINKLNSISGFGNIISRLIPSLDYNNERVKKEIKNFKETVQRNSGRNLRTYIKQFEGAASELTNAEFNALLYCFLTDESRKILDKKGIDPKQLTTSHFISSLSRLLTDDILSTKTLIDRVEHFIPSNPYNIMDIFDEILSILHNIPEDIWNNEEKESRLYRIILRITPDAFKKELEDTLTYKDLDDYVHYPDIETIHDFL